MGGDELSGAPGTKQVSLEAYSIDETPVTNAQFREFVKETKYRTDAEKYGWSFVLNSSLSKEVLAESEQHIQDAPQWVAVLNAWWRHPEGRDSSLKDRWKDYPAVHMSWNDATAKCLLQMGGQEIAHGGGVGERCQRKEERVPVSMGRQGLPWC